MLVICESLVCNGVFSTDYNCAVCGSNIKLVFFLCKHYLMIVASYEVLRGPFRDSISIIVLVLTYKDFRFYICTSVRQLLGFNKVTNGINFILRVQIIKLFFCLFECPRRVIFLSVCIS